jgi:hypothetical protein
MSDETNETKAEAKTEPEAPPPARGSYSITLGETDPNHRDFVLQRMEGILSEAALLGVHWLGEDARVRFIRAAMRTYDRIEGEYRRRRELRADALGDALRAAGWRQGPDEPPPAER